MAMIEYSGRGGASLVSGVGVIGRTGVGCRDGLESWRTLLVDREGHRRRLPPLPFPGQYVPQRCGNVPDKTFRETEGARSSTRIFQKLCMGYVLEWEGLVFSTKLRTIYRVRLVRSAP